jgi:hypothetical protein
MKQKKCKACKELFTPSRPLQSFCDFDCALLVAKSLRQKGERKELRAARVKAKTRRDWIADTQAAVNRYIRARDVKAGLPCISCGRFHQGQNHAGHYRATSIAPAIRFHPENIWLQCQPCNVHKHGNLLEYRIELIKRIGVERVEWLESDHEPVKYTILQLIEIKKEYAALLKGLK